MRPAASVGCASGWATSAVALLMWGTLLGSTRAQVPGRWGATSVLLSPSEGGGPTWLVLSGKTFVAGETSDSSPTSPTSLYLSLDDPALNLSSPSWRSFDSPATIYASAAPLDDSRALLFGGDATGDPAFPTQTTSDSSFVLDVLPAFITSSMVTRWGHPSSLWGSQPTRRESAFMVSATNGTVTKVWMYGGRRSDGSGTLLDELWELTIDLSSRHSALSSPSEGWRLLSASGSWPGAMSEGTAVLLTSPTGEAELWLLGGVQIDAQGNPQLVPLDTIHIYTPSTSSWSTVAVKNPPAARRDHVAVALAGGVWIQGGRNLDGSTVFGDGALLSFSSLARGSWTATASGGGARWGHVAVNVGGTAVLAFGYQANAPAGSSISIYDPKSDTWPSVLPPTSLASPPPFASSVGAGSQGAPPTAAGTVLPVPAAGTGAHPSTATPAWSVPGLLPVATSAFLPSSPSSIPNDPSSGNSSPTHLPSRSTSVLLPVLLTGFLLLLMGLGALLLHRRRRGSLRHRSRYAAMGADQDGHDSLVAQSTWQRDGIEATVPRTGEPESGLKRSISGLWRGRSVGTGTPLKRMVLEEDDAEWALFDAGEQDTHDFDSAAWDGGPCDSTGSYPDGFDEKGEKGEGDAGEAVRSQRRLSGGLCSVLSTVSEEGQADASPVLEGVSRRPPILYGTSFSPPASLSLRSSDSHSLSDQTHSLEAAGMTRTTSISNWFDRLRGVDEAGPGSKEIRDPTPAPLYEMGERDAFARRPIGLRLELTSLNSSTHRSSSPTALPVASPDPFLSPTSSASPQSPHHKASPSSGSMGHSVRSGVTASSSVVEHRIAGLEVVQWGREGSGDSRWSDRWEGQRRREPSGQSAIMGDWSGEHDGATRPLPVADEGSPFVDPPPTRLARRPTLRVRNHLTPSSSEGSLCTVESTGSRVTNPTSWDSHRRRSLPAAPVVQMPAPAVMARCDKEDTSLVRKQGVQAMIRQIEARTGALGVSELGDAGERGGRAHGLVKKSTLVVLNPDRLGNE